MYNLPNLPSDQTDPTIWRLCFAYHDLSRTDDRPVVRLVFTPHPADQVSGDDWDDVPYEHNAEPPHTGAVLTWTLPRSYLRAWYLPADLYQPSNLSVRLINHRPVPWLANPTVHRYLYPDSDPQTIATAFGIDLDTGHWAYHGPSRPHSGATL